MEKFTYSIKTSIGFATGTLEAESSVIAEEQLRKQYGGKIMIDDRDHPEADPVEHTIEIEEIKLEEVD